MLTANPDAPFLDTTRISIEKGPGVLGVNTARKLMQIPALTVVGNVGNHESLKLGFPARLKVVTRVSVLAWYWGVSAAEFY